ncbi:DinB family protein [Adhaeribacter soli]|uniref:DinB family protein n=1 Tax=Adhaeribacter soli TaxID=2607655 RepID=A0A5N1J6C6_9BACT|nr:DinB family protein [Adhaeribacter soli]KAA9340153.1 DinB family protein [Adhaeribacter soli]
MQLAKSFFLELERESKNTRKMLTAVPEDKFSWQPHAKSMSLMRLAAHIAEIPGMFVTHALASDSLDFATFNFQPKEVKSSGELLEFYDETLQPALEALKAASEDDLMKHWVMRQGEIELVNLPKFAIIRSLCLNHIVHHRGQLSVYLRLLDVPVPGMYGPSADEAF